MGTPGTKYWNHSWFLTAGIILSFLSLPLVLSDGGTEGETATVSEALPNVGAAEEQALYSQSVVGETDVEAAKIELLYGLFTPKCFTSLVLLQNYQDVECIKLVISKSLGYAIVCGSFLLKVPQIVKILQAKDVTGLSPSSMYLEVVIFLSTTVYNVLLQYPISTYGENIVILIQNIILVFLLWVYMKPSPSLLHIGSVTLALIGFAYAIQMTPMSHLWLLSVAPIPLSVVSRVPQIVSSFRLGHTGQLSAITVFLNFAGAAARVFTTLQETNDVFILIGFVLSVLLNGIMLSQIVVYWQKTNDFNHNMMKNKKN